MNEQLELLASRAGPGAQPIVVNAFIDERSEVEDSLASLKRTVFSQLFPRASLIDLAGSFIRDQLAQAATQARGFMCQRLGVSRSDYYAREERPESERHKADRALAEARLLPRPARMAPLATDITYVGTRQG